MKRLKEAPFNKACHDLKTRMKDSGRWGLQSCCTSILKEHKNVHFRAGIFEALAWVEFG